MIQAILTILASCVFALILQRRIEKILPDFVLLVGLGVYLCGIAGHLSLSIPIFYGSVFIIAISGCCYLRKQKDVRILQMIPELILTPQAAILCVTIAVFSFLYIGHAVIQWDDLSYWGIYAKNLFYLGHLPNGLENCSVSYKDYTPIQQVFQWFFMAGSSSFSEAALFRINISLLYLLMLPFLSFLKKEAGIRNAVSIVLFVVFPHIFSSHFYYRLGVDYLMGVLFGYGILTAFSTVQRKELELEDVVRLVIITSYLSLLKSSGIILAFFLCLFYALSGSIRIKMRLLRFGATFPVPGFAFLSWKWFLRRTGNSGYLSDQIHENIFRGKLSFPPYTAEVLLHYLKNFFLYPLTREKAGMTAFGMTVIIAAVFLMFREPGTIREEKKRLGLLMTCLLLFMIGHICMYLFVFYDWEAHGLLEYDRYICQYLSGVFYYYLYIMLSRSMQWEGRKRYAVTGMLLLLIILLPYRSFFRYMIPSNYQINKDREYGESMKKAEEEWEQSGISGLQLIQNGEQNLTLVADAWDPALQFFCYDAVPQPMAGVINVPAVEEGTLGGFIAARMNDYGTEYVYVMKNAEESIYKGDFKEDTKSLTRDGSGLEGGKIYRAIRTEKGRELVSVSQNEGF